MQSSSWAGFSSIKYFMIETDLSLHVHDDHSVGAVTHYKVLRVLGQQDDVVDGDVGACWRAQRFEGVWALGGLHVPHLRQVAERTRVIIKQTCDAVRPLDWAAALTFTVPSEEALMMWWPSGVKVASLTNEEWPRNSLRVLPDFSPWILYAKHTRITFTNIA